MTPDEKEAREFAAEFGADDGADPKAFHDRRRKHRSAPSACEKGPTRDRTPMTTVSGRKAMQLCGQVKDALHGILAGCADEVVRELVVLAVEPAPHTGRLMVTVAGPSPADAADPNAVADRLARAAGHVRSEVAASICRRHAPELVFRVV